MSNNLVINPHPATPNYSGHFPFRPLRKSIRSSSFRETNISSSLKSASLFPNYPILVPYSRIRSSKNSAIFYLKLIACLFGKSTVGRVEPQLNGFEGEIADKHPKGKPQLNGFEGGFEPDLNGFLNQKQSAATAGRVTKYPKSAEYSKSSKHSKGKPQLNGLEGGFEPDLNGFLNQKQSAATAGMGCRSCQVHASQMPSVFLGLARRYPKGKPQLNRLGGGIESDLNYFFPSQCDLTPRSGIKSKGAFVVDSFRSRTAVSLRFSQAIHSPKLPPLNPSTSLIINHQKINIGFGGGAEGGGGSVGVELESNCSRIAVFMRYPQAVHSSKLPPLNPATEIKIDLQNILTGFGGGARRAEGAFIDINSLFRGLILSCLNLPPLSVRAGRTVQINAARVKHISEWAE